VNELIKIEKIEKMAKGNFHRSIKRAKKQKQMATTDRLENRPSLATPATTDRLENRPSLATPATTDRLENRPSSTSNTILNKAEAFTGLQFRRDIVTPGDGSCFYHGCTDFNNLNPVNPKKDFMSLRTEVVHMVQNLIENPNRSVLSGFSKQTEEFWNTSPQTETFAEMIEKQKHKWEYVNEIFIQATVVYLEQDIEVISVSDTLKTSSYVYECKAKQPKEKKIVLGWINEHFQLLVETSRSKVEIPTAKIHATSISETPDQLENCPEATSTSETPDQLENCPETASTSETPDQLENCPEAASTSETPDQLENCPEAARTSGPDSVKK
jgi:hypothetical protein